ncbi:MAG TPA: lipocalin family protein [Terriglobales bacterium]|nr:lipocalin family protein [Terriglobales bacterium]
MTRKYALVALSTAALSILLAKTLLAKTTAAVRTVDRVDLGSYVGTWYEIARYPNRFQRKCVGDTKAMYTLRPDGKIRVVNACRQKNGEIDEARGTAKVVDKATNAKLKVTFFWPFSGDYWIIGLGDRYEYAIVGDPSRKYLWILSRSPNMAPTLYDRAIAQIEAAGYDPSKLMRTPQSLVVEPAAGVSSSAP